MNLTINTRAKVLLGGVPENVAWQLHLSPFGVHIHPDKREIRNVS